MALTPATPSEDIPDHNAAHPQKRGSPTATYHPGHQQFVDRPYDKHSKLYRKDLWEWHDLYDPQVSYAADSVVTRSQTAFARKEMDETDLQLFGDKTKHHPPFLPHLVDTMKDGTYGALPRTIVTRSMAAKLEPNPTLTKTVEAYKAFHTLEEEIKPAQARQKKPSIFQRMFSKDDVRVEKAKDGNKKGGSDEFLLRQNIKEASPKPVIRESSFSQGSGKNLSQPISSGLLRAPSFTVNRTGNFSTGYAQEVNSQPWQSLAAQQSESSRANENAVLIPAPQVCFSYFK